MGPAMQVKSGKNIGGAPADVYTALLGLAALALAATTALVCVYSYQMYETIFRVTSP